MDNTLYVGLSRQLTLQRALDVTANNLANVNTTGFKVESLTMNTDPATPSGGSINDSINYVIDANVARDFGQGGIERTGNPTDVAIEGEGFFTVQTANGPRYTRDGSFTVSAQNQLTDSAGDPVLTTNGTPITLDPTKSVLNISKDGTVSQSDPATATAAVLGKIGVSRFADLSVLSKQGSNLYDAPGVTPTLATNAHVMQGAVERSNVEPVVEITHLIAIQRAYEQVSQMISATQDLSDSAVQRLGKAA